MSSQKGVRTWQLWYWYCTPLESQSNVGQDEAPNPHHPSFMRNHRASIADDDSTADYQQPPNGLHNQVGTCARDEYHATWKFSETPDEALPIAHDEEYVTGTGYCVGPPAGSPPIRVATHEALQPL
ncbi:uncharacterized protein PG986_001600 [Apiospora aurea]|uniref:Uncharacterized protein n=1 Tax=Apiospora aurea TaxID=335848 RepID=A0ABR1QXZ4_9PEZI